MSSSLQVTKIHLSAPIVDATQAATKAYVDVSKGQSDAYAVQVSNQVKSDIMGGIPSASLDTIKELADYLSNGSISGSIVQQISALSTSINTEASRASSAESSLASSVSAEQSRASSAESSLASQISGQVSKQSADLATTSGLIADGVAARLALAGVVAQNKTDIGAALGVEQSRAVAAELKIVSDANTKSANLWTAVNGLVSVETTERKTDLSTLAAVVEANRVYSSNYDTSLENSMQNVEGDIQALQEKQSEDNTSVASSVAAETSRAVAAELKIVSDANAKFLQEQARVDGGFLSEAENVTRKFAERKEEFDQFKVDYATDRTSDAERDALARDDLGFILREEALTEQGARFLAEEGLDTRIRENKSEHDLLAESVSTLDSVTMKKNGGDFSGSVGITQLAYLYIGDYWRIAASTDGKQLTFEHSNKPRNHQDANWKVGVPFIQE
jgi:hypothetical protein